MKREILQSLRVLACVGTLMEGTVAVLAAQEPEPDEARSPSVACQRSILGTVVPIAAGFALSATGVTAFDDLEGLLVVGGLIFGPVHGYAYAGEVERGMAHAWTRAAVLGGTVGVLLVLGAVEGDTQSFGPSPAGEVVIVAGGVATIWLAVRDIIQVGDRVRARNQGLAAVSVRPTYLPEARTAGLLVTWRH